MVGKLHIFLYVYRRLTATEIELLLVVALSTQRGAWGYHHRGDE
jgi:hypothetical protein